MIEPEVRVRITVTFDTDPRIVPTWAKTMLEACPTDAKIVLEVYGTVVAHPEAR